MNADYFESLMCSSPQIVAYPW